MAVLTDITRAANEASELVPNEKIAGLLAGNFPLPAYLEVASLYTADTSRTVEVPLDVSTTVASGSTIAEGEDDLTLTAWNPTSTTITVSRKGVIRAITEEADYFSVLDLEAAVVANNFRVIMNQRDAFAIGGIVNATNEFDQSGTDMSSTIFIDAHATYVAQDPQPSALGHKVVLSIDAFTQLQKSVKDDGGAIMGAPVDSGMVGPGLFSAGSAQGKRGSYLGYDLIASNNAPAHDGSNWAGAFLACGDGGAIGLAIANLPDSDGMGFLMKVSAAGSLPDIKGQKYLAAYQFLGVDVVNQENILKVITAT